MSKNKRRRTARGGTAPKRGRARAAALRHGSETTIEDAGKAEPGPGAIAALATSAPAAEPIAAVAARGDGVVELQRAWMEWLVRSWRVGARAAEELLRCATLAEAAAVQHKLVAEAAQTFIAGSTDMLRLLTTPRRPPAARRPYP